MPVRRIARFAVVVGLLWSAGSLAGDHGVFAAGANDVTAGEFIVDPPTLINLGFEWFVSGDDNRNAGRRSLVPQSGDTRGSRRCRCCDCTASEIYNGAQLTSFRPTCSRAASWTSSRTRRTKRSSSCRIRTACKAKPEDSDRAHASGAEAVRRRPRLSRVSARIYKGQKLEPAFEGSDVRVQPDVLRNGLGDRRRPRVKPGDTILVHAGLYKYDRFEYTNDLAVRTHVLSTEPIT